MSESRPASPPLFASAAGPWVTVLNWHNAPEEEFVLYARAFHNAAQTLARSLDLDRMGRTDWNAPPVVFLYRHSAELYLKAIILGDGRNFLPQRPDAARVRQTHSLQWLFSFVQRIFTALGWTGKVDCGTVQAVNDLKRLLLELDTIDPRSHAFRYPVNTKGNSSVHGYFTFSVLEFAQTMDAVLEVLDTAIFGLNAEWDRRAEAAAESDCGQGD